MIVITLIALIVHSAAHQPFFEDEEFDIDNPGRIRDPTISTAMYSTLGKADDVDYYAFNASKNQSILLSITIPQIAGQDNFAPVMALIGPGLPPGYLPGNISNISKPEDAGFIILPAPLNASAFFEPFSRTSYWTRQEEYVVAPETGSYLVAVWDEKGQVGRYVFVVGDKEVSGGDLAFPLKMRDYWNPVDHSTADDNQTQVMARDDQK
jgi:hypothetical protein